MDWNRVSMILCAVILLSVSVHCGIVDMSHPLSNDTVVVAGLMPKVEFNIMMRGYWTDEIPHIW